jgi:hypothetical protein
LILNLFIGGDFGDFCKIIPLTTNGTGHN